MKYYSAIEDKEILTSATALMDLEDIMLSKISQTEKDKYCMISLICRLCRIYKNQIHRNRDQTGDCQRCAEQGRIG